MRHISFLLFVLCLLSCGSETTEDQSTTSTSAQSQEDCKYGKPVAVFSEELEAVAKHSFTPNGQKGVEELTFVDGTSMELYQSGCNEIRQEFRFFLQGAFTDKEKPYWFKTAKERMNYLANLSDKYLSFGLWGQAIEALAGQAALGQFMAVEQNTYIMVDRILESESNAIVIVVFERKG